MNSETLKTKVRIERCKLTTVKWHSQLWEKKKDKIVR